MKRGHFSLGCVLLLLTSQLFAANPISWTLDQPFPTPVLVAGGSYMSTYVFKNELPFTLIKPLVIEKKTNSETEFSFVDQCTGQKLAPHAICTVAVTLTPTSAGEKNVQLIIAGYDNNTVPLPPEVTTASTSTGVSISAVTTIPLPASMSVNTSDDFKFTFSNNGSSTATGVSISVNILNYSTTCGNTLAGGASCEVTGTFTPVSTNPASQSVTATFSFNQGSPVNISTTTTVTAATGITAQLVQALPGITTTNTNYTVTFSFTNNQGTAVNVNQTNTFPAAFTPTTNTCPNGGAAFAAGASCTITGTFNSAATGNFTITAQLTPTGPTPPPASVSTSTTVSASAAGRTLTFVNNCNFPVWFSLSGANRQSAGSDIPCTQDSNCPTGSRCNPTAGTAGQCFWENYAPSNNNFQLTASGGTNTVFIPTSTDPTLEWSGAISASTGCSGSSCVTANCQNSGGTTACAPGVGFSQPATQAEITMEKFTVDTYDIEVINGFHLPIQMTPSGTGVTANNYTCGSPGASTAGNNFGACNWNNAVVPSVVYNWVGGGSGTSCTSNANCSGGEICGLNIGISRVCGKFLGFWTANEACAVRSNGAQPFFQCEQYLGSPFPANTYQLSDLYGCKTPNASQPTLNTCYAGGATTQCCGCADWQTLSVMPAIVLPPAPTTQNCVQKDPIWVSSVQNTLVWMKQACPTAYTYPYDDKSSTFTCQDTNPTNSVNYTITFCAGGFTGLPSGATEGRNG